MLKCELDNVEGYRLSQRILLVNIVFGSLLQPMKGQYGDSGVITYLKVSLEECIQ